MSSEYKLPPKKTIGVITKVGTTDICSKLELIKPIKKPNNANVNATSISNIIIKNGFCTYTSTKNVEDINITIPTIKVYVAPAPTKAKTISKVDIGAAKIS